MKTVDCRTVGLRGLGGQRLVSSSHWWLERFKDLDGRSHEYIHTLVWVVPEDLLTVSDIPVKPFAFFGSTLFYTGS